MTTLTLCSAQITKCAVEKSRADAKVRRSTCSASSAMTQYSTTSTTSSVHQVSRPSNEGPPKVHEDFTIREKKAPTRSQFHVYHGVNSI